MINICFSSAKDASGSCQNWRGVVIFGRCDDGLCSRVLSLFGFVYNEESRIFGIRTLSVGQRIGFLEFKNGFCSVQILIVIKIIIINK